MVPHEQERKEGAPAETRRNTRARSCIHRVKLWALVAGGIMPTGCGTPKERRGVVRRRNRSCTAV